MDLKFLETQRLILRGLCSTDANQEYLAWLNDPDVLRFRGPKAYPSDIDGLKAYIEGISGRGDLVLAICLKSGGRHIGNIALNTIQWIHRSAELSMMIGAKDVWGQGYAKEAIHAVCGHAILSMGLCRVWAESPNPAFNRAVESLGWKHEGTKRDAFLLDGKLINIKCYSILKREFAPRPEFAP